MHLPTTTIVVPLKLDKVKSVKYSSQAFTRKFYCSFQKLGSDLQAPLKTTCIMHNQLYKL